MGCGTWPPADAMAPVVHADRGEPHPIGPKADRVRSSSVRRQAAGFFSTKVKMS